jgi:hypothetical protein
MILPHTSSREMAHSVPKNEQLCLPAADASHATCTQIFAVSLGGPCAICAQLACLGGGVHVAIPESAPRNTYVTRLGSIVQASVQVLVFAFVASPCACTCAY